MRIGVPRDRNFEFEPQLVKKGRAGDFTVAGVIEDTGMEEFTAAMSAVITARLA